MSLDILNRLVYNMIAKHEALIARSFIFNRVLQTNLFMDNDDNLIVTEYIDLNSHDIIMDGSNCVIEFTE